MTGLWWWWWWMSMSRQDCNNRPRGSVMRSRMPAMGSSDVLTADATLFRNAATGTMTPLWRAASKGLTNPSEMLNTNPINRGRNKPAATNLCNATKPITHRTARWDEHIELEYSKKNWKECLFLNVLRVLLCSWYTSLFSFNPIQNSCESSWFVYIEIRNAP